MRLAATIRLASSSHNWIASPRSISLTRRLSLDESLNVPREPLERQGRHTLHRFLAQLGRVPLGLQDLLADVVK